MLKMIYKLGKIDKKIDIHTYNHFWPSNDCSGDFVPHENDFHFWIYDKSNLTVVDGLTGSKISSMKFPDGWEISRIVSCVLKGNSLKTKFGLYVAVKINDKNAICCYDVISGRILNLFYVEHEVTCLHALKDCAINSINQLSLLKECPQLLVAGAIGGRLYLLNPDWSFFEFDRPIEIKPQKIKLTNDLDRFDFTNEMFCFDILGFMHVKSKFYWPEKNNTSRALSLSEIYVSAIHLLSDANLLAVGFDFGAFLFISLSSLNVLFYSSSVNQITYPVTRFISQEPENDPRATLFLWVCKEKISDYRSLQIDKESRDTNEANFEFYQLCFRNKTNRKDSVKYKDLEVCALRFSWSIDQNLHKILGVENFKIQSTINNEEKTDDLDTSALCEELDRSLAYFVWLEILPDEASSSLTRDPPPRTSIRGCLFDVNGWYHAQMPSRTTVVNRKNDFMVHHEFDWPKQIVEPRDLLDVRVLCPSVERYKDFVACESNHALSSNFFASTLSFDLIFAAKSSIFYGKIESLQENALNLLVQTGDRNLLSPNVQETFDILSQCGLIDTKSMDSSNFEREIRWSVFDQMLSAKRLNFFDRLSIDYRSTESSVITDFYFWLWDRANKYKSLFDDFVSRAIDGVLLNDDDDWSSSTINRSRCLTNRKFLPACDSTLIHRCCTNLNVLSILFDRSIDCFKSTVDCCDSEEINSRRDAISLVTDYLNLVTWFIDESFLMLCVEHYLRQLTYEYDLKFAGDVNEMLINLLTSKINENVNDETARLIFPPNSFYQLINVYLVPNVSYAMKHCYVFYTFLAVFGLISSEKEQIEFEQSCQKFIKCILDSLNPCLKFIVASIFDYDKNDIEGAKLNFGRVIAYGGPDYLNSSNLWSKFGQKIQIPHFLLGLMNFNDINRTKNEHLLLNSSCDLQEFQVYSLKSTFSDQIEQRQQQQQSNNDNESDECFFEFMQIYLRRLGLNVMTSFPIDEERFDYKNFFENCGFPASDANLALLFYNLKRCRYEQIFEQKNFNNEISSTFSKLESTGDKLHHVMAKFREILPTPQRKSTDPDVTGYSRQYLTNYGAKINKSPTKLDIEKVKLKSNLRTPVLKRNFLLPQQRKREFSVSKKAHLKLKAEPPIKKTKFDMSSDDSLFTCESPKSMKSTFKRGSLFSYEFKRNPKVDLLKNEAIRQLLSSPVQRNVAVHKHSTAVKPPKPPAPSFTSLVDRGATTSIRCTQIHSSEPKTYFTRSRDHEQQLTATPLRRSPIESYLNRSISPASPSASPVVATTLHSILKCQSSPKTSIQTRLSETGVSVTKRFRFEFSESEDEKDIGKQPETTSSKENRESVEDQPFSTNTELEIPKLIIEHIEETPELTSAREEHVEEQIFEEHLPASTSTSKNLPLSEDPSSDTKQGSFISGRLPKTKPPSRSLTTRPRRKSVTPSSTAVEKFVFSPPTVINEEETMMSQDTYTDTVTETEPSSAITATFVFSPPVTRSRSKLMTSGQQQAIECQTTPFAEKLRKKAVRRSSRLTRTRLSSTRSSKNQ